MDPQQRQALINYLSTFITPHKIQLMHKVLQERTRHIAVVIEDVFQPHNISAAIRSAECFGVQDVHIIEQRHSFVPDVSVTRGSSQWVSLVHYNNKEINNTAACFERLRAQGYKMAATSPHAKSYTISDVPLDEKLAIVFGTEDVGISDYVVQNADYHVVIPMYGFTESFNISVSVALCLYELTHRLRQSSIDWRLSENETVEIYLHWLRSTIRGSSILEDQFMQRYDAQ